MTVEHATVELKGRLDEVEETMTEEQKRAYERDKRRTLAIVGDVSLLARDVPIVSGHVHVWTRLPKEDSEESSVLKAEMLQILLQFLQMKGVNVTMPSSVPPPPSEPPAEDGLEAFKEGDRVRFFADGNGHYICVVRKVSPYSPHVFLESENPEQGIRGWFPARALAKVDG